MALSLGAQLADAGKNAVRVLFDLEIPEPNDQEPKRFQVCVSDAIVFDSFLGRVSVAIEFDYERR